MVICDSFMLLYVVIIRIVFLYINTTQIHLSILLFMDIWVISSLVPSWMELQWTFLRITFGEHKHLFLLGKYPGVKLSCDGVYGCLALVDTKFTNLLSHKPDMRVPGALYPHQHLALCAFNFCPPGGDIVVFHCAFNLYFPDD